jgi:hypothetical protein
MFALNSTGNDFFLGTFIPYRLFFFLPPSEVRLEVAQW